MPSTWTDLPQPRALTPEERELLTTLVSHTGCGPLAEQLRTVRVTGKCRCGCGSVRLDTAGPTLPAATIARLSSTGRDDWFSIQATDADDPGVSVVAHVVGGLLLDLEIYAGERVPAKAPVRLKDLWIA